MKFVLVENPKRKKDIDAIRELVKGERLSYPYPDESGNYLLVTSHWLSTTQLLQLSNLTELTLLKKQQWEGTFEEILQEARALHMESLGINLGDIIQFHDRMGMEHFGKVEEYDGEEFKVWESVKAGERFWPVTKDRFVKVVYKCPLPQTRRDLLDSLDRLIDGRDDELGELLTNIKYFLERTK